jgi:intraflagellar transport protein 46
MSGIDVDESSNATTTTGSDESTASSTTSSASDAGVAPPRPAGPTGANAVVGGIELHHQPHDLEVAVDDGEHAETPRAHGAAGANAAAAAVAHSAVNGGIKRDIGGAVAAAGGSELTNQPHDMAFNVEDDEDEEDEESDDDDVQISVPASAAAAAAAAASAGSRPTASISGATSGPAGGGKSGTLANQVSDYFQDVEDDVDSDGEVSTPVRDASPGSTAGSITPEQQQQRSYAAQQQQQQQQAQAQAAAAAAAQQQQRLQAQASGQMQPPPSSSDSDTATESDSEEEGYSHASPGSATNASANAPSGSGGLEYNPGDFAHLLPTLSQEVRDLFGYITDFKPVIPECPTKLIPFIPEYMPCIGDIDNFCKIPRPDGRADNLGLVALDEPSSTQTHPAVVKMQLAQILRVPPPDSAVTSIEDAANQPQKIDKWIADMKELQQKKPLPNVIYNGPMPDIESLLQVWPEGFEQFLSSDIALPPPGIDLDIFQYVRLLCNLVDIPTSANLVESLHLMFSLYLEFRQNQHFQHA